MARRCFFTSYATFFLPQFSTLMTLPPSRCTTPRRRSTILSTRSSARSGRRRKMVSYSRNLVPGACCAAPPPVCVSACCMSVTSWVCRRSWPPARSTACLRFALLSAGLLGPPVEPVLRRRRPVEERRHRRVRRDRHHLLRHLLLLFREPRQHEVRRVPPLRRPPDAGADPDEVRPQVLPQALQPVVTTVAATHLHLDPSELEVQIVVRHHQLPQVRLPEPRRVPYRFARQVHER